MPTTTVNPTVSGVTAAAQQPVGSGQSIFAHRAWPLQYSLQLLSSTTMDAVGAANSWAGTLKNNSPTLGLIAALNYKNGWRSGPLLDLNLVCNQLASTTNLSADYAMYLLSGGT